MRAENGKFVEYRTFSDMLGLMTRLGVVVL
jgi:hypothetical protein